MADNKKNNLPRGILCMIASAFCFALMGIFVHAAGDIRFLQKAFFRNLFAFIIALPAAIKFLLPPKLHTKLSADKNPVQHSNNISELQKNNIDTNLQTPLQTSLNNHNNIKMILLFLFLRSATGVLGIFGNFYALDRIPIADALMLNKLSPFFAVIFSAIFLKEVLRPIPLICTITALLGALMVVRPGPEIFSEPAALIAFIGGMGAGAAYTCVRVLGKLQVKGAIIVAFFSAFSCLLCSPCFLQFQPMTASQWLCLIACGLAASGGQFGITYAYYYAAAKDVSVYDYSNVIFAAILAFIIFGQVPDILSFVGYFVIIGAAVGVFLYNKKNTTH